MKTRRGSIAITLAASLMLTFAGDALSADGYRIRESVHVVSTSGP